MAQDINTKAHDRVKSPNEAKLESDRVETRTKIVRETDGPEALSIIKAYEEKAGKNTAHLPKFELVDKSKRDTTKPAENEETEKEKVGEKPAERAKKEGESLPAANEAERLKKTLEENHSLTGRSSANCERDLRDTLSTLPSEGIAKLQKDFQERTGKSLTDTIKGDDKISPETKAALAIYMKGADKRTDSDTLALADIAVKAKNLDLFQETFRDATAGARQQYIEHGGVSKVEESFQKKDQVHALEYLAQGKESTVTKINESLGTFNDNEKAIDAALKGMSDSERQSYINGKAIAETLPASKDLSKDSYNNLTAQEKSDYDQYHQVHAALKKAGNESEVLRWEDLVVNKEQTLVGKVSSHGGMINDRADSLMVDIENMPKSDFERLKTDPKQKETVEQAIAANYGGNELEQARELLNKKLSFDNFEEAKTNGNRATVDVLKDKTSVFGTDDQGIMDALKKMTVEEQKRYREDAEYKKQIDTLVDSAFHGRMQEVDAKRILADVSRGEKPQEDIVGKLALQAYTFSPDKSTTLSDIEAAMKADSGLAKRLLNPQTEEDKATAAQFHEYTKSTFGSSGYEQYVKPLLEKGELPLAQKVNVNDGLIDDDLKGVMNAIKTASAEDRSKLVANPETVLPFLSKDERQLAVAVAEHGGAMRPEDKMRAAVLGMSGDKETIKELSSQLSEEQRQKLAKDYEHQYGKNLVSDLSDKLSGQDEVEAVRSFKNLLSTARESFNQARDEEYQSNDGIGRNFVRNHWDGTADTSRDSLNQYAADMTGYAREHQDMPKDEVNQNKAKLASSVDLLRESKTGAADAVADGAIIAAGVGGSVFTGGASLELIGATGLAGGALKVGTKSTLMGDDYHWQAGQVASDATTGAVEGATSVLGPAHMARMLNLETTASTASGSMLKNTLQELSLNSGAGTVAGGSSGFVEGAKNWDSSKRLDENLKLVGEETLAGSAMGGILGGGTSLGLEGLTAGVRRAQDLAPGNHDIGNLARGHFSDISGKADDLILDANGRITEINATTPIKVSYHTEGNQEGAVQKIEMANGTSYESLGGDKWRVVENGSTQAREIEGNITVGHTGEIQIKQADGNTKTISGVEGWVKEFDKASGQISLKDADGHLLSIEARNGHSTHYQYDSQGKLSQIELDNGHTINSADGGKSWTIKTKGDSEPKPINGDVTLDSDGNVHIKPQANDKFKPGQADSGNMLPEQVFRIDGSYSNIDAATGKPSSLVRADGSHETYEYAPDGSLNKLTYVKGENAGNYLVRDPKDASAMLEFDKTGKLINDLHDNVEIEKNGCKISNFGTRETVDLTDGGLILRLPLSHNTIWERPPANAKLAGESGTGGSPLAETLEQRKSIQKQFASTEAIDDPRTIKQVALELKSVKNSGTDSPGSTVYESLMNTNVLSDAQKENVLRHLAQVREHFAVSQSSEGLKSGATDDFLHTQVAIGKVLDLSRANKLSGAETEDALLASIYSNSMKAGTHSPDIQNDPAFKQLSEAQKQEVQSRMRVAQTVGDADALARQAMVDGSISVTAAPSAFGIKANQQDKALFESKPLELPGIKPEEIKAGEKVFESPENHFKAWRSEKTSFLYVMDTQSNVMRTFDSDNRLRMVIAGDSSREVHYSANGDIDSVKLKNKTDGAYNTISAGFGKDLKVDADGTVKVIKHNIDGDEVTRYNLDGSSERIRPSGRVEYEKADYAHEKARLQETFQNAFEDSANNLDRLTRVKGYMAEFEKEAAQPYRNLDQNSQALLYKQLNRLLSENPDAVLPLNRRLDLAEQALEHSAYPWSVAQGQNGTCNVTTIEHRIYWRSPDKNVQMLADIAQNGKYRFASGREIDLRNSSGNLSVDSDSVLNIQRQNIGRYNANTDAPVEGANALRRDGSRDFSSEILQTAMVNNHWAKAVAVVDAQGRQLNGADLAMRYDKTGEAIGIVNAKNLKPIYDESGSLAKEIKPETAYHYGDQSPVGKLSEWQGIYSKDGQLQGVIADGTQVKAVYDISGKKIQSALDSSVASGKYFDENGNLLVLYTQPGDIQYRKFTARANRDAERLTVDIGGESKELKFADGTPVSSPKLYVEQLLPISNDVTGFADKPFVLANNSKEANVVSFKSEEELVAAIRKLEAENNLPAILKVDATHAPFNAPPSIGADGLSNNGHVINVHGVSEALDPRYVSLPDSQYPDKTRLVIYSTNQWGQRGNTYTEFTGTKHNTLEDGYPATQLYQATVPYKAVY